MNIPTPFPREPTTDPLPYAAPVTRGSFVGAARVFHFGIFLWSLALVVAWMLILVFVLPRFEQVFMDFKTELPATTKVLFAARTGVVYGGFAVLLLLPFVLGFVSGPLGPGGRRALRMVVTLLFALVVVLTVLGIFQPLMALMSGASGGGGKR